MSARVSVHATYVLKKSQGKLLSAIISSPLQGDMDMKFTAMISVAALLAASPAMAAVKLINKDAKAHDIKIHCTTTSTGSIQSNTTREIGKGPCTVTVNGSSAKGADGDTLVIKGGKVGKQ